MHHFILAVKRVGEGELLSEGKTVFVLVHQIHGVGYFASIAPLDGVAKTIHSDGLQLEKIIYQVRLVHADLAGEAGRQLRV